jgi:uncharacterized protein (PEP-CTERM system associated)
MQQESKKVRPKGGVYRHVIFCSAIALGAMASSHVALAQDAPSAPAAAGSGSYVELRSTFERTDNVFRTIGDEVDDTLASVGLAVSYERDGRLLDVGAVGDLEWVEYLDDSYPGQLLGLMNARADWQTPSEVFMWGMVDTFGQLTNDPRAAATPDSLENVNYFSTGPTVNVPLGDATQLSLSGLYSNTSYEESDFDSKQYDLGLGVVRQL